MIAEFKTALPPVRSGAVIMPTLTEKRPMRRRRRAKPVLIEPVAAEQLDYFQDRRLALGIVWGKWGDRAMDSIKPPVLSGQGLLKLTIASSIMIQCGLAVERSIRQSHLMR
jgi:hypothetical protein